MSWRVANSLVRLRDQVNAAYPNRNKASDGTIGDAAHAATASDHNPNGAGVVCALDITHDPSSGCDTFALADRLLANRHPDLKYLISNKRIAGAWTNWRWVAYQGADPHTSHVHVSVGRGNDGQSQPPYDDTNDWAVVDGAPRPQPQGGKSVADVAKEVVAGNWGNGQDRVNALTAAGYNYNDVQNAVNALVGSPSAAASTKKSNDEIAVEVRKGYWGNGNDRKKALTDAGYDYNAVQAIVNATLSVPTASLKSNDEVAKEVLRGDWGNGDDRKNRLTGAGYDYNAVQAIVNNQASSQAPARQSDSDVADAVIRGDYGNGQDRINRLRDAGYNPMVIQNIVNSRV